MQWERTYIYKRENDSYRKSALTIPWSSFAIYSGDTTHRVTRLISVSATLKLYVGTAESASYIGWTGTFQTASGNFAASVRSSFKVNPGKWGQVTANWDVTQFTAAAFAGITNLVSDADYGNANTNFAKSNGYLYVKIVYESDEYFPVINGYSGSRYNGSQPDDLGQQLIYSFAPTATKTTSEATSEYPSYINFSVNGSVIKTIADTRAGSSMEQINALIGSQQSGVISNYTFSIGAGYVVTLNFCYHGELVSQSVYIGKSFVNFHFSGATDALGNEIGGVAVGQYSSVTRQEGIPKFESDYISFFYKGIHGVNVYSTGEINTGGKWIDGKTIYRRMVTFDAVAGTNQTAHDSGGNEIKISGISSLVNIQGVAVWPGTKVFAPLNFYAGNSQYTTVWLASDPSRIYYSSSSACAITLALYYTKEE